jgi:hypothetical protein
MSSFKSLKHYSDAARLEYGAIGKFVFIETSDLHNEIKQWVKNNLNINPSEYQIEGTTDCYMVVSIENFNKELPKNFYIDVDVHGVIIRLVISGDVYEFSRLDRYTAVLRTINFSYGYLDLMGAECYVRAGFSKGQYKTDAPAGFIIMGTSNGY